MLRSAIATTRAVTGRRNQRGSSFSTFTSPSLREIVNHPGDASYLAARATSYFALRVDVHEGVAQIILNRPEKMNSLNVPMWAELIDAFDAASRDSDVRVCVLKGEGKHFSAGMDLTVFAEMRKIADEEACEGRKREKVYNSIDFFQRSVTAPEACTKPVLCSMQGAVIGGAVDLATACDIRYVHNKAQLSVKEIDLAIVADVGTMQRLPHIVGDQRARELTYTGRTFSGAQAVEYGLALEGFDSSDDLDSHVMSVASEIATKSPLTIRGIKKVAVYTRDHNTDDALLHVAQHNSAMLFSEDLDAAMAGMMAKKEPVYRGN